ncbi:MAG: translation elongation factor Ts [Gammaproteobacteria bacterium RIFCSPHIGHO2_12_FULL_37_14]|nr:MAG: translation elongation factor Ts [Gammaproteobacteria bacterium RIFCSPHIGHO2_12_FULL_37_14]
MAKIEIGSIQELREKTGMGMLDCRKALEESGGDIQQAIEILRKRGVAVAQKRAGKSTSEGIVHAYIHPGDQIGVLLEVNCETDFVARTKELKEFANNICLQIVAQKPMYLNPEEVDQKFLEHEKDIMKAQLTNSGKPEKIIDQIVQGKVNKLYSDVCLLKQAYIKNDQLTVEQLLQELIAKTGENIKIRRFCRFEIGD